MHIPDGYLGPGTCAFFYALMLPIWITASRMVKKTLQAKQVPILAMGAAFTFVVMMFNVPIPGGTTGHAVGAGIIAILLGPWTAVIAVSVSLMIQAIVFGDGGITAIGANCFNMAVVMPFVSYWVFKLIRGNAVGGARLSIAAFLSGYVGLSVAAILTGFEFGIQPLLATGPDGRPLYAPYPLSVALPAMALQHMLLFSVLEGVVTVLLCKYFVKHEFGLVYALTVKEA